MGRRRWLRVGSWRSSGLLLGVGWRSSGLLWPASCLWPAVLLLALERQPTAVCLLRCWLLRAAPYHLPCHWCCIWSGLWPSHWCCRWSLPVVPVAAVCAGLPSVAYVVSGSSPWRQRRLLPLRAALPAAPLLDFCLEPCRSSAVSLTALPQL